MWLVILALGILAAPGAAGAQQPLTIPRVGFLSHGSPADPIRQRALEAFRQGLRELGYVEGQNIALEYRYAEGKLGRLPSLASELVNLPVDVIVTSGDASVRAASRATRTIPIVVAISADLVRPGYVASLARPGKNITGLVDMSPELSAKRLQLLKEAVPKASRVAVLRNAANQVKADEFREMQEAARALGIQLQSMEIRSANDLEPAFSTMARERAVALIVLEDALTNNNRRRILDSAGRTRLPAMYAERGWVDAGGLMSYGPHVADMWHRAATYVDKILKGAKPADLPVEQPTRFELVINLKTAKALGLTIPQSVLIRADQVIQ